jgi:DNA polymerase
MAVSSAPARPSAEPWVPRGASLQELREAVTRCEGCELHAPATQAVFGEGDPSARLVLVGEQPGDVEDREGRPFVGPAGALLQRALDELGVRREEVYLTNAVKHFAFTQRGKRRIHRSPSLTDLVACRPWLEAELEQLTPAVLVCLGATAARSVLGPGHTVRDLRGTLLDRPEGGYVLVTTHPSAVLRATDRGAAYEGMLADLRVAVGALSQE